MPSEAAKAELLRALQNSRDRLEYLNSDDWAFLVDKAEVLTFAKDEVLIQAGIRPASCSLSFTVKLSSSRPAV